MSKQIAWFKRKFDFGLQQNIFPSIIERLEGTPLRLEYKVQAFSPDLLTSKPDRKWSVKENIGHLIDLEPLWQGRLLDILESREFLRETDLSNAKTDQAQHNHTPLDQLFTRFASARRETVAQLIKLNEKDIFRAALHPRLKQPMRTMDLFLFVAEHDDHHLAAISSIKAGYGAAN